MFYLLLISHTVCPCLYPLLFRSGRIFSERMKSFLCYSPPEANDCQYKWSIIFFSFLSNVMITVGTKEIKHLCEYNLSLHLLGVLIRLFVHQ